MFLLSQCEQTMPSTTWLSKDEVELTRQIETHFRGFDVAMVETGYRYQELWWAGQDFNWAYAHYQVDKLGLTIRQGLERRPLRAKSAQHFMDVALPGMLTAIEARDSSRFRIAFHHLTASCNNCHAMEKVAFFEVHPPTHRNSPIRFISSQQ